MHINNISEKALSFILHKRFHPGSYKNLEKVWLAEQEAAARASREQELASKRLQEHRLEELRRAGGAAPALQWVAANEEFSKAFTTPQQPSSGHNKDANKQQKKPYIVAELNRFGTVDEADMQRKLKEDPFMLVQKAEALRQRREQRKKARAPFPEETGDRREASEDVRRRYPNRDDRSSDSPPRRQYWDPSPSPPRRQHQNETLPHRQYQNDTPLDRNDSPPRRRRINEDVYEQPHKRRRERREEYGPYKEEYRRDDHRPSRRRQSRDDREDIFERHVFADTRSQTRREESPRNASLHESESEELGPPATMAASIRERQAGRERLFGREPRARSPSRSLPPMTVAEMEAAGSQLNEQRSKRARKAALEALVNERVQNLVPDFL